MAIINARDWLDERLGSGWFADTARLHDPEWPERVLPGEWYSIRTSQFVYTRAAELLDDFATTEDLMERVSIEVALNDLNGMLRAFLWASSPRMFLRTSRRVWANYVDFSEVELLVNDTGYYEARITEIPEDVVPWVVAGWKGFLPPALELAGGKNVEVSIRDRQRTPGDERWEFVYEARYE
jgi:hypothetical protein